MRFKKNLIEKYFFVMEKIDFEKKNFFFSNEIFSMKKKYFSMRFFLNLIYFLQAFECIRSQLLTLPNKEVRAVTVRANPKMYVFFYICCIREPDFKIPLRYSRIRFLSERINSEAFQFGNHRFKAYSESYGSFGSDGPDAVG